MDNNTGNPSGNLDFVVSVHQRAQEKADEYYKLLHEKTTYRKCYLTLQRNTSNN